MVNIFFIFCDLNRFCCRSCNWLFFVPRGVGGGSDHDEGIDITGNSDRKANERNESGDISA